ncbi:Conserved_hypothetical protein [Hexamita inflata]|uniref:B box-type domain-containing protein n=1 Tax=Hexamita inflata TaxID=28002 RepID=A0AA86NR79_9EUKA|nr:Conserved hypothetical protein [Hexamita inflata]
MSRLTSSKLSDSSRPVLPSSIAATVVQQLNERSYCDFCCKPLTTAFELNCNHCYCGECILAISQQESVDIPADLLREAAEQAYQGKNVQITSQNLSAMSMTQQANQLPEISCPLCLRQLATLTAVNPQKRASSRLCQECNQNERTLRCSSCSCELCDECDKKIHGFSTMKMHQRTPIANAGNVTGQLIQMPCSAQCHKIVVSAALLKGETNSYGVSHPLYVEATSCNVSAEYFCMDDRQLICKFCKSSEFYKNKKIITIQDAVEQKVRELREETDKCRQLTGELRQLMFKYQECDRLDENLYEIAVAELRTTRDVILSLVQQKFDKMETELETTLNRRTEINKTAQTSLSTVVEKMMNSVSSAEKHMLARQPVVFLQEFQNLYLQIKANLKNVLVDLETRPEPRRSAFPRPERIDDVKRVLETIQLNETQVIVEAVGLNVRQCVCCKDCGNVVVNGAGNLRQVARKQKGCLFGLLLESVEPDSISLDTVKGQPGSRHVICRKCGRELGRWSQPDAPDKKFTPGYIFISQNVVK